MGLLRSAPMPLADLQRVGWEGLLKREALSRKTCLTKPSVSSRLNGRPVELSFALLTKVFNAPVHQP